MCGGMQCARNDACCDASQSCYQSTCTTCCNATAAACASTSDCAMGQYCAGAGCGTMGLCEGVPTRCGGRMAPVCGCDGMTYMSECLAQQAGTRAAMSGACSGGPPDAGVVDAGVIDAGPPTGGSCVTDTDCANTEYCQSASCLATGTCQLRPDSTTCTTFQPVCGCDNQTYENACSAAANGVNVASTASCGADAG